MNNNRVSSDELAEDFAMGESNPNGASNDGENDDLVQVSGGGVIISKLLEDIKSIL